MSDKKLKMLGKNRFKPGLPMSIFFLIFFPLLIILGFWQIERASFKEQMWNSFEERKQLSSLEESSIGHTLEEDLFYRSLSLEGSYLPKSFLLDNRMYRNKKGFELFTPFITNSKKVFLVNRGWLSIDKAFKFNEKELVGNKISIGGMIIPFKRFGLDLGNKTIKHDWPRVVQEITYNQVIKDLGIKDLYFGILQLSAGYKSSFEPIWKPSQFKASRHIGYSVQWFGLAICLLISFIYFGFRMNKDEYK